MMPQAKKSNYFSPKKRGGKIASANLAHQDAVAAILSVRLIAGDLYPDIDSNNQDWKIQSEGNDDIEVVADKFQIFVQVKSSSITPKEFETILDNFAKNNSQITKERKYFRIHAFEGLSAKNAELPVKLKELAANFKSYGQQEYDAALEELAKSYGIKKELLHCLEIDTDPMESQSKRTIAWFGDYLRKIYPIRDYSYELVERVYNHLTYFEFARCRNARTCLEKSKITGTILDFITPSNEIPTSQFSYVLTKDGYQINSDYQKYHLHEQSLMYKCKENIHNEWLMYYWRNSLKNAITGEWEICPVCSHPLMANFGGLNGIACPDCGFTPFVTLIIVCDCGSYSVVKKQPHLNSANIFDLISRFMASDPTCQSCKKKFAPEKARFRWMLVPWPLPVTDYLHGSMKEYVEKYSNSELDK